MGSFQAWAVGLQRGDSFEKGYPAMLTVSANLKRAIRRMPPCIIQISSEQHSQTSSSLNHPKRVLIPQDAIDRMMPCTMSRCPSAVPGRSVVSANNLDPEVKAHWKLDLLEESSTLAKCICEIWIISYYVSIITLTWRDSCIKRWQFSTSTLYHPKFEWATLAKEGEVWLRAFHSFHLIETPVMTCHDVTLPSIRRWTRTWRLRRVPDWGIFSVKRLHWRPKCLPWKQVSWNHLPVAHLHFVFPRFKDPPRPRLLGLNGARTLGSKWEISKLDFLSELLSLILCAPHLRVSAPTVTCAAFNTLVDWTLSWVRIM